MLASIMGLPDWLYYSLIVLLLLGAIGFLVYTIKNRDDDDDE